MEVVNIYIKNRIVFFNTKDGKWYEAIFEWQPMEVTEEEVFETLKLTKEKNNNH